MATVTADRALAVELCERDFESVLARMLQLRLDETSPETTGCTAGLNGAADQPNVVLAQLDVGAAEEDNCGTPSCGNSSTADTSGAEWVEILVGEMASAASVDDARCRAAGILEAFQGSVSARVVSDRERVLGKQNTILKKAVVLQHRRHLQDEAKGKELQGQVDEYRERVRLLELDNYKLSMHLRTAHAGGSMAGSFHPDIF